MARVILDTVNHLDRDFQKFLKRNGITTAPYDDCPNGLSIAYVYDGDREALEKMIDTYFFDDYLKNFIKEETA